MNKIEDELVEALTFRPRKLDPIDVIEISDDERPHGTIAAQYGISKAMVGLIQNGQRYSSIWNRAHPFSPENHSEAGEGNPFQHPMCTGTG